MTETRELVSTLNGDRMTWQRPGWGDWALVDHTGCIRGNVSRLYREYTATTDAQNLGRYIDEECAKRAVERALWLVVKSNATAGANVP